ncbi:SRPBCC domain-containing protein [Glaciecola sp. XM2]|jgi:uncharacterized protein YndB with AHSA1/START domain|uniref:SRPBCC family protein n=1 Tax=Glaciecola sp. XM2 TaxID=1914931 RepID=UPI001BDE1FC5|nr:SRPBCC domain-containing protein [Glaciecola sp. XM2]MBT1452509.1 SRPBCC domain-containing protein [Glaciecola sp. XM2]
MFDFTINGILNASLGNVFNAFCRPELIMRWCAPGNLSVSQFHSQFSTGGNFQMVLQSPDGFQQTVVGTYQDIKPNQFISFTWRWEDTNDITKVEICFSARPSKDVSIQLTQRGFKREQDMLQQQFSWLACFEKLAMVTRESATNYVGELHQQYVEQTPTLSP